MVKKSMDDLLKRRMSAAQQASELEVGNEAYETMFQAKADVAAPRFCELPIKSLCPFRTADIGFRPYPPEKLRAFSQQLAEQGIYERIIVRPVPNSEQYEILAGHNRTEAWRLTGQSTIPAEVVEADDARAISIAVATNLLRRQDLTIIERGKAYRALLIESNRNGQRNVAYAWLDASTMRIGYAANGMPDYGADQMYQAAKNAGIQGTDYGTVSSMPEIPGLMLWKSGHAGVYIGGGYAIEAMGTRKGVVKTEVSGRGWQGWCKLPYIDYLEVE